MNFLIVLVTLICADNGRTFVLAGNGIDILLHHHNDKNSEKPHQIHFSNLNDDEKWLQSDKVKIQASDLVLLPSLFNAENPSGDFSDSVWQPPKQV